jgi:hypothetical protein
VTSELLTEFQANIAKRIEDLRPSYLEYMELSAYMERMAGFEAPVSAEAVTQAAPPAPAVKTAPAAATKPAAPRQRPGSTAKKPAAKKPAAKAPAVNANEGQTVAKIKEIVSSHPEGISVGDIIKEGQLSTSYTYDVVKRLVAGKELDKKNKKIFLHETSRSTRRPAATPAEEAPQPQPQEPVAA